MPTSAADPLYWDSCCFLAIVNGEADRIGDLEAVIEEANTNGVAIITSTVAIVEVARGHTEQDGTLDEEVLAKIDALWAWDSPFTLVEFYQLIAERARGLMRQAVARDLGSLKPMDAIHLATASHLGAKVFHTYDEPLDKFADLTGLEIKRPESATPMLGLGGGEGA